MANLYEINQALIDTIELGVDTDTGELLEGDDLANRLNELNIALNDKLEGIAKYSKSLSYDIDAFDSEIEKLKHRKEQTVKKQERINNYLSTYLLNNGYDNGFSTPSIQVKFRKSTTVEVLDQNVVPKDFLVTKIVESTKVDKAKVKDYLKNNPDTKIDGVYLQENKNMRIE